MNYFKEIDEFLERTNYYREGEVKGYSMQEIRVLNNLLDRSVPDAVIQYLSKYAKSDYSNINLYSLYLNLTLHKKYHSKSFLEMRKEYTDDFEEEGEPPLDINKFDESKMLILNHNLPGHGNWEVKFLYPITENNPNVYHCNDGFLVGSPIPFSEYAASVIKSIPRSLEFKGKSIDRYLWIAKHLNIENIEELEIQIDLRDCIYPIPRAIFENRKIKSLNYSFGRYDIFDKLFKINKDTLASITLSYIHINSPLIVPFSEKLEMISIYNMTGAKLIFKTLGYRNLRKITIANCPFLQTFPEEICEILSLESLSITSAEIKEIPSSLSNLKKLLFLNLWGCRIDSLPHNIHEFNFLEVLNIAHNKLSEQDIARLKAVLPNTKITSLGQKIK
jgi:hypothetical protein